MADANPAEFEGNPYTTLSSRFWTLWALGFVVLIGGMAGVLWLLFPYMDTLPAVAASGATVIVFTLGLIALSSVPARVLQKRGPERKMRPAYRRYTWRFLPAMFLYVICLLGAMVYWKEMHPTGVIAWLVGLAPSLPVLFAIRAVILLPQEEDDEYLRDRLYRSYAWGAGATAAICTVIGFLDLFEVIPHVEAWVVFPMWAVCFGVARCVKLPSLAPAAAR